MNLLRRSLLNIVYVFSAAALLVIVLLWSLYYSTMPASAHMPVPRQQGTIPTATAVLTATKDNTLYETNNGNASNGAGTFFFVGTNGEDTIRRGLLYFDLAAQLPADATILSATLQLHMSRSNDGSPVSVGLYRATSDWGEGSSAASGNQGQGAAAAAGDATWLHTFHDTALWETPGGDFVPTATVTSTVGDIGLYTWASLDLVDELQQWLNEPSTNHGWVLVGDESVASTAKRFSSRENGTSTNQPQLTILYQSATIQQTSIYLPLIQNE